MIIINSLIKNKIMIKKIVIFGALALAGVGAYIYFKPKAKVTGTDTTGAGTTGAGTTSTGTSGTGTAGTGTAGTSPTPAPTDTILNTAPIVNPNAPITNAQSAQNMEELAKFTQAQGLATQIVNLRSVKKPAKFSFGQNSQTYLSEMVQNTQIDAQISSIVSQMNTLGYKEANGVATKL
jgi:hypothetical protein